MKTLIVMFVAFSFVTLFSCQKEEGISAAQDPVDAKGSLAGNKLNIDHIVGLTDICKSMNNTYPDNLKGFISFKDNILVITKNDSVIYERSFLPSYSGTQVTLVSTDENLAGTYKVLETVMAQGVPQLILRKVPTGQIWEICLNK